MIPFTKGHGNGNDFVLFIQERCPESIRDPAFIRRLCDRHTGVGADGVLILQNDSESEVDFQLDYFNSDGSWETLCANGSRCAVRLFAREEKKQGWFTLRAGDGLHRAEILENGHIRLQMRPPVYVAEQMEVRGFSGRQVDSGAPHFVIEVSVATEDIAA
ncbi:hypothetical protein ACFLZR_00100, partial [Candidatus Neomarinimicrobiota bacterium]